MDAARWQVLEAAGAAFALPISDGQLESSDSPIGNPMEPVQEVLEAVWERLMDVQQVVDDDLVSRKLC